MDHNLSVEILLTWVHLWLMLIIAIAIANPLHHIYIFYCDEYTYTYQVMNTELRHSVSRDSCVHMTQMTSIQGRVIKGDLRSNDEASRPRDQSATQDHFTAQPAAATNSITACSSYKQQHSLQQLQTAAQPAAATNSITACRSYKQHHSLQQLQAASQPAAATNSNAACSSYKQHHSLQ